MISYRQFRNSYNAFNKTAAAILTPEAEQSMVQQQQAGMPPPMDPSMGGMPPQGAPMDPSMQGGAPMPPQGAPMDPSMGGMPPQGTQLPPEIMQDQQFIMMLQQMMGIQMDPNSGTFIGPDGQPVPPDIIMQAYQEYMAQMQSGGMPPQDPSMGGMPPQGAPMDPGMGQEPDPSMMGGGEMPPEEAGGDAGEDPMAQSIASTVMTSIESVIQEYTAATEKKISALVDMVKELKDTIDRLSDQTDERNTRQKEEDSKVMDDLAAELSPTAFKAEETAPVAKEASVKVPDDTPRLIDILQKGRI